MPGVVIQHDKLRSLAARMLAAAGSNETEAGIVAENLVEANLQGHDSHGVGLLPMYMRDRGRNHVHANQHPELVRDDGAIAVFDGHMGFGHVAAREVTEKAIAKAKNSGTAIVALRNAYHLARVGTYGQMANAAGLVMIAFVNVVHAIPRIAPFGGSDGRLLTNPICIAIPAGQGHPELVLDFATSKYALGKVRVAYNEKRPFTPGALIDHTGQPTTDPKVIYEPPYGAMVSFGDYKGYGLALMCEILAGALSGGMAINAERAKDESIAVTNNMFGIFVDPTRLVDGALFHAEIADMLRYVTASPPADPDNPVVAPGDPERARRKKRLIDGIAIDPVTWGDMQAAAKAVGVAE